MGGTQGSRKKRFLYLFQVEDELPDNLLGAYGPDSDVRFLSYRRPSSDPRQLFYPSSSWTQGRNRLFREYMDGDWTYLIFGDADVRLVLTGRGRRLATGDRNPWREFERFLLEHEPAVGTPQYDWHLSRRSDSSRDVQTLRFFDPVFNAFHREAWPALLPYCDLLDEECVDYSGGILTATAAELYPGHVLQSNRVRVLNPVTVRHYRERLMTKGETLYLESLRDPEAIAAFRRQPEWPQLPHHEVGPPRCKERSYSVTEAELSRRYHLEHRLWSRKRALVALPKDHHFYGADGESERARRWREHGTGSAPRPTGALQRLWVRTAGLRASIGLTRSSPLFAPVRWAHSARRAAHLWSYQRRERRQSPNGFELWRSWARDSDRALSLPPGLRVLTRLLNTLLNRLPERQIVLLDVGTGTGEPCGYLRAGLSRRKSVASIGVDPEQTRGYGWYSGYVLGKLGDPFMDLDLILTQFGLGEGPVHWVRVAEGDGGLALRSLGERLGNCLFITLRVSPVEARSFTESPPPMLEQFRLLAESTSDVGGSHDLTFVNLQMAEPFLSALRS